MDAWVFYWTSVYRNFYFILISIIMFNVCVQHLRHEKYEPGWRSLGSSCKNPGLDTSTTPKTNFVKNVMVLRAFCNESDNDYQCPIARMQDRPCYGWNVMSAIKPFQLCEIATIAASVYILVLFGWNRPVLFWINTFSIRNTKGCFWLSTI